MKTSVTPNTVLSNKFIHFNPQSKGNLGKSLEVELRCAWLDRHGIPWRGSDLDERHRTFFRRHPDAVKCFELGNSQEAKAEFMKLLRGALSGQFPINVVDTRAQADELFMNALEQLSFFNLCRAEGARMTFFLFPSDELESMENFRRLVQFGAKKVNYVVVDNPVRGGSRLFRGSPIAKALDGMGAKTIKLPVISSPTMLSMAKAEAQAKRGIPFAEFATASSGHLEHIMVAEMQWALGYMYSQYDAIADLLLPQELAEKVRQTVAETKVSREQLLPANEDLDFNFED